MITIKCILLCAGYGTRLYPLTKNVAKPLLPIAGRPMIEHILFRVEEVEHVDTVYVVTNDKFYKNFVEWKKTYKGSKPIVIINDGTKTNEDRLGPIGDVHFVIKQELIDEDIVVLAGDNLFGFSLLDMHAFFHRVGSSVVGLYDIKDKEKIKKRFGNAVLDAEFKIADFVEKPENPLTTLAATCCYMVRKTDLEELERFIQEHGTTEAGNFITWLAENTQAYGFVFAEQWFDVGTPEDYALVNALYKKT